MTAAYDTELQKLSRQPSTLVVISLDRCTRTFGSSPCLATGAPCYNTYQTCKYKAAYNATTQDYKFCCNTTTQPLPGQIIRPYLIDEKYVAQEISPSEALTINQQVDLTMLEEDDDDIWVDPYRVSATLRSAPGGTQAVAAQGGFWRKLRARSPNYINRMVTIKHGFIVPGFTEDDYNTVFTGVFYNLQFAPGEAIVSVKGLLALTDQDYPTKTDGKLDAAMLTTDTSLTLSSGTGTISDVIGLTSQYDTSGYIVIEGEVMSYTGVSVDLGTGQTTLTGLTRGLYQAYGWTAAAAHGATAEVQQAYVLNGNPLDLMVALLESAGIPSGNIDTTLFASERDLWFSSTQFLGILDQPVKIKDLLQELRAQTNTVIWQGDDQLIKVKFLGPNQPGSSYRLITDSNNLVSNTNGSSLTIDDNSIQRITRASIYYDIIATKDISDPSNFQHAAVTLDAEAESATLYNDVKVRTPMYSRWVRTALLGDAYGRLICQKIVARFRDGNRLITFTLELKDEGLALGEIFQLLSQEIVDKDGAPALSYFMVTSKERTGLGTIQYKAAQVSNISTRSAFIAPSTVSRDYDTATDADKQYCYIVSGTSLTFDDGTGPYLIS